MNARRIFNRYIVNHYVTLKSKDGADKKVMLKDLSSGGASIILDRLPYQNEKLKLFIDAPQLIGQPAIREAECVWSKKLSESFWQLGLSFGADLLEITNQAVQINQPQNNKSFSPIKTNKLLLVLFVAAVFFAVISRHPELKKQIQQESFTIQGILFDQADRSMVLIGNKLYAEGEKIGQSLIRKINKDSVEIQTNNGSKIVRVSPPPETPAK